MGVLEIVTRRNLERNKENPLVVEEAMKLWYEIEPDKDPTPDLPTATYRLRYTDAERYSIDEKEIHGINRNTKIFDSLLRRYWTTEEDISVEVKLHINPSYVNHGKIDKVSLSFELDIGVLPPNQPSDGEYITVFGFREYVQKESFGPFKKHRKQHQIEIFGESKMYSGDLSMRIVESPKELRPIRFITMEQAKTSAEAIMPHNIDWRDRFAMNALDLLAFDLKEVPLEARRRIY